MSKEKISVFWFRRDLRLDDNHGWWRAQQNGLPVLPLFIFDSNITDELNRDDPRVTFIYDQLVSISSAIEEKSGSLLCKKGNPLQVWEAIIKEFDIQTVYANEDYEPYAIERDQKMEHLFSEHGIRFRLYKDQVIFAKEDVLKDDNTPYTVFTPYKKKWLKKFNAHTVQNYFTGSPLNLFQHDASFPSLKELGFERSSIRVLDYCIDALENYKEMRDFPAADQTSYLSPHLRFGTVSIRRVVKETSVISDFLSELIWREFFMQILYHFPRVVGANFKEKYDGIQWQNHPEEFELWKKGETGYPMVDAGMRQLNATGYMHNRVRMVAAGFLCKHLLIDWRWGEAYFAEKLLDYELSSNNGNWQWAAGTGCDAAPYFRVFNPTEQVKKFDPERIYIKKWIPEWESGQYPAPIIEHKKARERAIAVYKEGIKFNSAKNS